MPQIVVCPLSCVEEAARTYGALDMVTLIGTGTEVPLPMQIVPERYLRLDFHDIVEPAEGMTPPGEEHVAALIGFARRWALRGRGETPLLIHCYAGISRSTAAAFISAAALNPRRDPFELAQRLRACSPSATPNMRLIRLADAMLARDGRMIEAVAAIGRGAEAFEGEVFSFSPDGP